MTSLPHSTPMGAQFTAPSAPIVVTMLSTIMESLQQEKACPLRLQYLPAPHLPVEIERIEDDGDRLGGAEQVLDDDLLLLERLVVLEEPAQLAKHVVGKLILVR